MGGVSIVWCHLYRVVLCTVLNMAPSLLLCVWFPAARVLHSAITCSEMCIVVCYVYLCHGDYNWWWRSFLTSGSCAIHVFLYSVYYYHTQLNISKTLSMFLYFGYNLIFAFVIFILTGTIGYQATLVFLRKIYSEIKLD